MKGIYPSDHVTDMMLGGGVALKVFGTREEVKKKIRHADHEGNVLIPFKGVSITEGGFEALDIDVSHRHIMYVGPDSKLPPPQYDLELEAQKAVTGKANGKSQAIHLGKAKAH